MRRSLESTGTSLFCSCPTSSVEVSKAWMWKWFWLLPSPVSESPSRSQQLPITNLRYVRFPLNISQWRDIGVLQWLAALCRPDHGAARDKDLREGPDAGSCRNVSEVGERTTREDNRQIRDRREVVDSSSTNLRHAVYQRSQVLAGGRYFGS